MADPNQDSDTQIEKPQLYLITPPQIDLAVFPDQLAGLLDAHEIACVRMALSTQDEQQLLRTGDALREITHARDIALVIQDHVALIERLGLDGVHLSDGNRQVREVRKTLGSDAIVGTHCNDSRHDGMAAGEAGADYISFGPCRSNALNDGAFAPLDLFQWWSEVIEVPVVAEGLLDMDTLTQLTPYTDFFGIGDEIWNSDNPSKTLSKIEEAIN